MQVSEHPGQVVYPVWTANYSKLPVQGPVSLWNVIMIFLAWFYCPSLLTELLGCCVRLTEPCSELLFCANPAQTLRVAALSTMERRCLERPQMSGIGQELGGA